jgi:3-phosphoshikimate 1-carboxyvinyltransferase
MFDIPHLDIPPMAGARGTVRLPGSKSISNRVLLLAGLSEGSTLVRQPLESDDTQVMIAALRTLGCRITAEGDDLRVEGIAGRPTTAEAELFLGNAGTAMRPLAAALAVIAAIRGGRYRLDGVPRMRERPIGDLVNALRQLGCGVDDAGVPGYPPLVLHGQAGSRLKLGDPIQVRGDVSSQFLTALLLALPLVAEHQTVTIEVIGELISKPYIEITIALLARFGIAVQREGWQRFTVPAGSAYRSPGQITVEGDASSASYFIALGAIGATKAPVRIEGVGLDSIQGDIRFVEAACAMGARIEGGDGWLDVRRGSWPLRSLTINANHIPDAAMTLAAMALYADGPTRIENIASWRVKETDRIAAIAAEWRKLGAEVVEGADFIEVRPPQRWQAAAIHTYDDHRIAMCASLAALNPLAAHAADARPQPVRILDPRCVGKTFPDYFEAFFDIAEALPQAVPVLTVDGPTASGKGTLAGALARKLGFHLLDSGALYRATALAALQHSVALEDEASLATIAGSLDLRFKDGRVWLAGEDASDAIRHEDVGVMASRISALPAVRQALLALQRHFRQAPGLVADGRDMGTTVFPEATLKIYLTANASQRAERRYKQLIDKGIPAKLDSLRADLEARDLRDTGRTASPLKPAEDALLLDNSALTVDQSADLVLDWWEQRRPF